MHKTLKKKKQKKKCGKEVKGIKGKGKLIASNMQIAAKPFKETRAKGENALMH